MRANSTSIMYFKHKNFKLLIHNTKFTEVDWNLPGVFSRFLKTCSPVYTRSECISVVRATESLKTVLFWARQSREIHKITFEGQKITFIKGLKELWGLETLAGACVFLQVTYRRDSIKSQQRKRIMDLSLTCWNTGRVLLSVSLKFPLNSEVVLYAGR